MKRLTKHIVPALIGFVAGMIFGGTESGQKFSSKLQFWKKDR